MPVILDPETWDKAERQRHSARQVRGKIRYWLLQGMCVCGICGHVLGCEKKKGKQPRYYVCRGRHREHHPDRSPTCSLPYIRAERLEIMVWNRIKQVLSDPITLRHYAAKAIEELEQRRSQIGAGHLDLEKNMATVKKKQERLGMAFTDGILTQNQYKARLNQLKKQETDLLHRLHNLDPNEFVEINELSQRITAVKELLESGDIKITDLGLFATKDGKYVPLGFNP